MYGGPNGEDSAAAVCAAVLGDLVTAVEAVDHATTSVVVSHVKEAVSEVVTAITQVEVYDPTPVIRGYDICEPLPPAARAEPLQVTSFVLPLRGHVSTASAEQPRPGGLEEVESSVLAANRSSPGVVAVADEAERTRPVEGAQVNSEPQAVDPLQAKVCETWHLMFDSRYEDEQDESDHSARNESAPIGFTPKIRISKRQSSVRAKLEQGRRLDRRLQHSVEEPQVRPRSKEPSERSTSRRRPKPVGWLEEERPFENAGFATTAVRFCLEKAMAQAVQCLVELHAIAQNEPKPATNGLVMGLFMAQWELNQVLVGLFGDPTTTPSAVAANLRLENAEYAALPLETLLQVSWFLPLDDFPRLRVLVAEVSRKRLSEPKLAILNAALHRHFVLRPYPGVCMQRLLLRVVDALVPPADKTSHQVGDSDVDHIPATAGLVGELLHALHIRIPPTLVPTIGVTAFMQLNPFEMKNRFHLSSVVSIQRVLFFRYFIEALATHKASPACGANAWWPRSTGPPQKSLERRNSEAPSEMTTSHRPAVRRKKRPEKTRPASARGTSMPDEPTDVGSDRPMGFSTTATHGSAPSPRPATATPSAVEPPCVESASSVFTRLNEALTAALTTLVWANPWLVDETDETSGTPTAAAATRASFLAAETFQQSLTVMTASGLPMTPSILAKIQEFTVIINDLASRPAQTRAEPSDLPPEYESPAELLAPPAKPPPPKVQRAHSGSFPPPYVSTSPAYWTFNPEIPAPSTPASSIPRSVSKANASPGVGDYDIQRSDKLTFQQRAGHSFGKHGLAPVDETVEQMHRATPIKRNSVRSTRAVHESASVASLDPPAYTHWASAAVGTVRDAGDDDDAMDEQVRDALRLQQSFVLDDLVQNLLHRGTSVANSRVPVKRVERPQSATTHMCEAVRVPKTSRVVSRVRTIATARAVESPKKAVRVVRPQSPPPPPPPYYKTEVKQPPRDYEPSVDDAHLQWAARVSAFYKSKLKAAIAID